MWQVAERQKGVITRAQLRESGLTDDEIDGRIARRILVRLHAGVFAIAGGADSFERRVLAALLAAGGDAVASHRAAAALLRLGRVEGCVEISVPNSQRPRLSGVTVHRVLCLPPWHSGRVGHVRVTSVARTICDLASLLGLRDLESLLDQALASRRVTLRQVVRTMKDMPARFHGAGKLRELLDERPEGRARFESPLEQDLRDLLRAARITGWTPQYEVAGCRVDAAFQDAKLAVQVDSYLHHSSRSDWARDHRRLTALAEAGWRVLPVTLEDLRDRAGLARRIRGALDVSPSPGR